MAPTRYAPARALSLSDVECNGIALKQEVRHFDTESVSSRSSSDAMAAAKAPSDASKPKRKKAKRACGACQKSHITCDDNRPCGQCVSKKKPDQCVDGPRKKAKYLHDAPNEALSLGRRPTHRIDGQNNGNTAASTSTSSSSSIDIDRNSGSRQHTFVAPVTAHTYEHRPSLPDSQSMPPPRPDSNPYGLYGGAQSPMSPQLPPQQNSSSHTVGTRNSLPSTALESQQNFSPQYLDPSDPGLFDFDLPSMNFGNHYGALEFGMLGHMSSGSTDATMNSLQSPMDGSVSFSSQTYNPSQQYPEGQLANALVQGPDVNDWGSSPSHQGPMVPTFDSAANDMNDQWRSGGQPLPHAYAIASGRGSFSVQSPSSSIDVINIEPRTSGDAHPTKHQQFDYALPNARTQSDMQAPAQRIEDKLSLSEPPPPRATEPSEAISKNLPTSLRKDPAFSACRLRDPSSIYSAVTKPYPYTAAFHRMYEMLKRRFDSRKRARIAQALASVRPSFISLNRTLTREDLVFMEKCFQRGLWDYSDFEKSCGTPTIICRRTGEIAHTVKEFTLLSQWPKDVLLGRSPNLNTNKLRTSGDASGTATNSSSRGGQNTPKTGVTDHPDMTQPQGDESLGKQNPIFLAELLDDDSVVKFYEDFSRLAFADSKGYAWSSCKLLKYRPPSNLSASSSAESTPVSVQKLQRTKQISYKPGQPKSNGLNGKSKTNGGPVISPEEGMNHLGERDGFVNCMYCWYVKRDVFNIPNMIVLNFLPIL